MTFLIVCFLLRKGSVCRRPLSESRSPSVLSSDAIFNIHGFYKACKTWQRQDRIWENQSEHGVSAVSMDHSYKDQFPWNYILGAQTLPDAASKQRASACDSWLLVGQSIIVHFILAAPCQS